MRRKMIWTFVFLFFILISMQGCSSIKDETELMLDLQSSKAFSVPDGVEVKNLSIIKRLTDEKNKTDKVFIQVDIENTELSQTRAYVMDYTHYNEGWMLDNMEEYWQDDYWTVHPKKEPSVDTILDELIYWSDSSIQENYEWSMIDYPIQGPMFFEEGKYETSFKDGKMEDTSYTCVVSVMRPFGYVTSFEDIWVTMAIDPYNYSWELISAESMALSADWYIARDWSSNDVNIYFSNVQLVEDSLILADPVAYGECMYDTALQLTIPSFECIMPATATMEYSGFRGTIYGEITLWPDKMWIVDSDGELAEFSGSIESCLAGARTTEKYAALAQKWFEALYVEHDIDSFISMIHPVERSEFEGMETPDWETAPTLDGFGHCNLTLSFVKNCFATEIYLSVMEHLSEEGYNTENVSEIGILEFAYILNGEQGSMRILVIEDGGQQYILGG